MKYTAGVLVFLMVSRGGPPTASPPPALALPDPPGQEWLADPVLPELFGGAIEMDWPNDALAHEIPPLLDLAYSPLQDLRDQDPADIEAAFPRGITALDIQRWQEEDDRRRIREWLSEGTLGLPMLVPQVVLEALLPRGIAVGPSTFLYRKSTGSTSLALVVFDQVLFHEAEFLANLRARSTDGIVYPGDLSDGQRRVFRKAFMGGVRASYAMPRLTMDLVFQTAADHGIAGYVLGPPVAGALLYFKGIDQKMQLHDDLMVRLKVASGRDWVRGVRSDDGDPILSFEVRFCDLPVGVIGSFDLSSRGLTPEFIGLGTSLEALEELLGHEEYERPSRR